MPEFRLTRRLLLVAALAALVVLLVVLRPRPAPELTRRLPPRVEALCAVRQDLQPRVSLVGRLQPAARARLAFEVGGRLVARQVEPGQVVAQGDVLLRIDDADYADRLREAEAQLRLERAAVARDRALLALAEKNEALQAQEVARRRKLGVKGLAARSGLDQAKRQLLQLQADEERLRQAVAGAEARLALKRLARDRAARDLERTRLRAPFAGVVNAVQVQPGDFVQPARTVLELVDLANLDARAQVAQRVAAGLHPGESIDVTVGDRRLEGVLIAVAPDPDARTFTHEVRVRVPGRGLMPGALARLQFPLPPIPRALTLPPTAVLHDAGTTYVFVLQPDGRHIRRRAVTLGPRVGERQVIRAGLAPGVAVVARDVAALSDGETVQPVRPPPCLRSPP